VPRDDAADLGRQPLAEMPGGHGALDDPDDPLVETVTFAEQISHQLDRFLPHEQLYGEDVP
jgi:hypothetical protein